MSFNTNFTLLVIQQVLRCVRQFVVCLKKKPHTTEKGSKYQRVVDGKEEDVMLRSNSTETCTLCVYTPLMTVCVR